MVQLNRAQRRKDNGVNKRGLHKPKLGTKMLLVYGTSKFYHFVQTIKLKNGKTRYITHTIPA